LNRRKARVWDAMPKEEKRLYQEDQATREREGNARLDFRFKY